MIYITHDQAEAMALADRIAVMDKGRVLQFATPSQLYREPADETVARFVGEGMVLPVEVVASTATPACNARPLRPSRALALRAAQQPRTRRARVPACARTAHRRASTPRAIARTRHQRDLPGRSFPHRSTRRGASRRKCCTRRARAVRARARRDRQRRDRRRLGDSRIGGGLTMRLALHGGFGEKGRTCLGVESRWLPSAARRRREDQRARQRRLLSGHRRRTRCARSTRSSSRTRTRITSPRSAGASPAASPAASS